MNLTRRQTQIVHLLARGETAEQVAHQIHRDAGTIRRHVLLARKRVHAKNTAHLIAIAISRGWIAPLMLVLMFTDLHHQAMRVRQPSRNRIFDSAMVIPFGKTSSSAGDDGPEPTTDIWMEMAA